MLRILLAVLFAVAPLAQAETYKWVDERGVVNYSNAPPPASAKGAIPAQTVPDRISSYASGPVTNQAVEVYRRLDANQQDWLQRQQLMAMQAAATPQPETNYYDYAPYYYPVYSVVPATRRGFHRPPHFTPIRSGPHPTPRASLRRF